MTHELLTVAQALAIVRQHATPLGPRRIDLLDAAGLVLAEDVRADADSPSFDKALMDGYALRLNDRAELDVVEEIPAGKVPARRVEPGQASRIMTGAMLPVGAEAVVPIERTSSQGDRVRIEANEAKPIRPGDNILPRGREMRQGETILEAGKCLSPQDLGLLATLGQSRPLVQAPAEVTIFSTGDEVVPWNATPGPGQIRNSNGPMLMAQVQRFGRLARARFGGILRDDRDALRAGLAAGLESDVLLLSGGVSAGKFDLVPEVLASLGVVALFHKIALKPGKPLLFGTRARRNQPAALVFAMPGNPVASFVCFELFVRPALHLLTGSKAETHLESASLAQAVEHRSDRPTYHPGEWVVTEQGLRVQLVPWFGSADLRGLTRATLLVVLPAGDVSLAAGDPVDTIDLRTNG